MQERADPDFAHAAPRGLRGVQAHGVAEAPLLRAVVPEGLEALAAQRAHRLRVVCRHARGLLCHLLLL
jgi:hypothetical protein